MKRGLRCLAVLAFVPAVVTVFVSVPGCKKRTTDAIAVIPKGTTHEFWKSVHAGAEKAAQELGVDIIWKGPLREDDRDGSGESGRELHHMHVTGIVLAPLDDTALVPAGDRRGSRRHPRGDLRLGHQGRATIVSFVATDNYRGGTLAGEHLAKLLGDKGKVIMLRYQEGSASTAERESGFLDAIAEHNGIEVVSAQPVRRRDHGERVQGQRESAQLAQGAVTG